KSGKQTPDPVTREIVALRVQGHQPGDLALGKVGGVHFLIPEWKWITGRDPPRSALSRFLHLARHLLQPQLRPRCRRQGDPEICAAGCAATSQLSAAIAGAESPCRPCRAPSDIPPAESPRGAFREWSAR